MKKTLFFIAVVASVALAGEFSTLEIKLQKDIENNRLDQFSLIEAALILSGANNPDTLSHYLDWYNQLVLVLKSYHFDNFDRVGTAGKIFSYLHSNWLITYKERATTLLDVVNAKRFNCVAGTILFNLVCADLGLDTEAFETPSHTYSIFPNFTQTITVENTTPMGFNIMQNLREYSLYLRQFYPEKEAYQIGLDRIYSYENSKGRAIDNTELIGLLAYNRAYFAREENDFQKAYEFVLLAQSFNRDSRSNVNFEINLYYTWGKQLFDRQDFDQAFTVYADAYYRYSNNKDFAYNCKAAFFNAMLANWQKKNWAKAHQLTLEVMDLELLEDKDLVRLQEMLQGWALYFSQVRDSEKSEQVVAVLRAIDPDDPRIEALQQLLKQKN